jgi:glyoxylase-like metal-dependent hydrolase (beta-lactamase superfamily II)
MVAEGVWHLPGFPANWINTYVIEDVLVDTSHRGAAGGIVKELGSRRPSSVVLTHVHPDHQGSAHFLCEKYGVPLRCHPGDQASMEGTGTMAPHSLVARVSDRLLSGPPHPVSGVIREGDEVADFRVYHTPGHTAGHVVFFRESDGVAIVGDVLNGMDLRTSRPGLHEPPAGFSADPAQNRESIRKLAELDPAIVCFGHGPILRDGKKVKAFARGLRED